MKRAELFAVVIGLAIDKPIVPPLEGMAGLPSRTDQRKETRMSIGTAVVVCGQVVIFDEHGKQGKKILLHGGDYLQGYTSSTVSVMHGEHVDVYSQHAKLLFKVYAPRWIPS